MDHNASDSDVDIIMNLEKALGTCPAGSGAAGSSGSVVFLTQELRYALSELKVVEKSVIERVQFGSFRPTKSEKLTGDTWSHFWKLESESAARFP